jgi:hypothetical protein
MLRVFNAFQLVCVFSGLPFLISWLATTPFPYAEAAFWAAIAVYVITFGGNIAAVSQFLRNGERL